MSLELLGSQVVDIHEHHIEHVEERDVNFYGQFGMQNELDLLFKEMVDGFSDACLGICDHLCSSLIRNTFSVMAASKYNQH